MGRAHGSTLAAAAFAAALFCSASTAYAAACCTSATVGGAGRLLAWEKAAFGTRWTFSRTVGTWDRDGDWAELGDTTHEDDLRVDLWAMGRLTRRSSLAAVVPYVRNWRGGGDLATEAGRVGDISASWRHEWVQIGERLRWPAVSTTLTVVAPTGRATDAANDPLGADVTGRGAWQNSAALTAEWVRGDGFLQATVAGRYAWATYRDDLDQRQRFGAGVEGRLDGGVAVHADWVVAANIGARHEGAVRYEGIALPDGARTALSVGAALSWRAHPHWTVQAGASTGVFVARMGHNEAGRWATTAGVRYGLF